jgi:hypothetical protein
MKKNKLNNIKRHVQGKFFTLERKVRNKTQKYCAKLVSESAQYMTITDINTGDEVKMNKSTVTALNCGQFVV